MLESLPTQKSNDDLLFNHVTSSLSELDLEIIRSIPPGGNWQDIPLETAKKSARIMQIRKSGGRTTYYGRLRPDMPSYTVNTYFYRPGNGSFIHYSQHRMISLREAARLQSFPDDFIFQGSFSSICKQIGNAIPPLLARALGLSLRRGPAVDLFAGAGGLSLGLKQSGHDVIVAAEINRAMCSTYHFNHPHTKVLCLDLSLSEHYQHLIETIETLLKGRTLRLLAGGPPCQGFSTAGYWNTTDSRNDLVSVMLQAVDDLQPEQVLIENVLGIRWMANGHFLNRVLEILTRIGYTPCYYILKAEQYGVPQRRRRIFIVATRDSDPWTPPPPMFEAIPRGAKSLTSIPLTGLLLPVTVEDAISDLPPLFPGGGNTKAHYDSEWVPGKYQQLMRGIISFDRFLSSNV